MTPMIFPALLALTVGLGQGLWHFAALRWFSAQLLSAERRPAWQLAGLQLLRLALLVGVGWLAARAGAVPLLSWGAGLLLARALSLARSRQQAQGEGRAR
jgi:F1F0 ATPase subunit 2